MSLGSTEDSFRGGGFRATHASPWQRTLLHLAVFLLAAALLAVISPAIDRLTDFHRNVVLETGINIILAVSLNLILGMAGQFSLGHAGLMGAGAYTAVILAVKPAFVLPQVSFWHLWLHFPLPLTFTMILISGVIAGAAMGALFGLVVGLPTLRLLVPVRPKCATWMPCAVRKRSGMSRSMRRPWNSPVA